jgi:SAM-dependent methyltransferase
MDYNKRSNDIFNRAYRKGKTRSERVLWFNTNKQYFRFAEILHFIDSRSASILDIGCGNGEFYNYLNFNGYTGKYLGIDINKNLLTEARKAFPRGEFQYADFFKQAIKPHDYVVMSGVFNAQFGQDFTFIKKFILRMAQLSKYKTIFNAITTHVTHRERSMYYLDPGLVLSFIAEKASATFEIRHGFVPYNYTVCIHRQNPWRSLQEMGNNGNPRK